MLRVVTILVKGREDMGRKVFKADKIMTRVLPGAEQADYFLNALRLQTNKKDLMTGVKFAETWFHYKRY